MTLWILHSAVMQKGYVLLKNARMYGLEGGASVKEIRASSWFELEIAR